MEITKDCETEIGKLLLSIGITGNAAFQYMKRALRIILAQPGQMVKTCVLYQTLATYFKRTSACIERCMRHSIMVADNRDCIKNMNELYGAHVITCRPTVSELLLILAEYLSTHCRCHCKIK